MIFHMNAAYPLKRDWIEEIYSTQLLRNPSSLDQRLPDLVDCLGNEARVTLPRRAALGTSVTRRCLDCGPARAGLPTASRRR